LSPGWRIVGEKIKIGVFKKIIGVSLEREAMHDPIDVISRSRM